MQNLAKKGEGKHGSSLLPYLESFWYPLGKVTALQHRFQHKHAQRVLRAKLHAGEKAMEQVFRSAVVAYRLWGGG